jgi:hypothetical protein
LGNKKQIESVRQGSFPREDPMSDRILQPVVYEHVLDFLYSKIRRTGREILDEQGFFPELPVHRDGSRWAYWAEEVEIDQPGDGVQPYP